MKLLSKLAQKGYDKFFGQRCDIRDGIRYFDEHHFPGLIKESFEFTNSNGFAIRGAYYHYDEYDKDTLIVLCHGMGGGHQAYMKEIAYLARNGFKVLSVDYQGTILSDGDKLGGPSQALMDMDKCINIVKNKYKNIYVIGHSWGGWVAQGLCALHPEITKLVTLAGMVSIDGLLSQYFKGLLNFIKKPILEIEKNNYPDYYQSSAINTLNERQDLHALLYQSLDDKILVPKYNLLDIQDKVKNDNVEIVFTNHRYHNPNYTENAVKLLSQYLHKLNKIKTKEDADKLADSTDWDQLCELDESVMDHIVEFFKN